MKKNTKKEPKKNKRQRKKITKIISKHKQILKRDEILVPFRQGKITEAVYKAFKETGEGGIREARVVSQSVVRLLNKNFKEHPPTVEDVQDRVEKALMDTGFDKTAKAYILYRDNRRKIRDTEASLEDAVDLINQYIGEEDWQVKENSNMAYSLQGLNNYVSSIVSGKYWMDRVYNKNIKRAHDEGDLHIHDLDKISAYCCGWDLQDLLTRGFTGVSGKISCAPPKHFKTALGQIVNFFYTTQGEAAGAQAFSNFDTLLAPFIYYDKLNYKEIKQAMQEFVYNLNVPTRVGFQTPFTNLTMDLQVPKNYQKQNVIVGGEIKDKKYKDFQKEMNLLNQAFLEVMSEGDASGRVFTFPIPTYNIDKDFNWDDKELDLLWEMTAKYGIPYFANFVNSDMDPDDARSMCCRLRLDNRELHKRMGGLFGAAPLTGSIGVVTINLPRIGYLAEDKKDFFKRLDKQMDIAKNSLEIKRKVVEDLTKKGLYPYSKFYMDSIFQKRGGYWSNHFSTIGLIGMSEALLNFMGETTSTKKGVKFAEKILEHMRDRMIKYQEETNNLYNLEATPGEGTSYRLALKDKKRFPQIMFANNDAVRTEDVPPYYTNSSQLPVGFTEDIFEALDLQDDLQTKYTGGTVLHGFLGERINDPQIAKELVKKITKNYALPYFTLTPTFSICPIHGYIAGEHKTCPKCIADAKKVKVKKVVFQTKV